MKHSEKPTIERTETQPAVVKINEARRSEVALCCLNAAAMLRLASDGKHKAHKEGQAELLERAADIADDMLAALRPLASAAAEFEWVTKKDIDSEGVFLWVVTSNCRESVPQITVGDAFRAQAVLAKAEGRS